MAHLHIKNTVIPDRRLPMPGRVVVLGRSLDVDVPVPHASVSRRHALIEASDDGYLLSDLGSSNGTFVDGERLADGERRQLMLDTPFRVGEVVFRISPDEAIEDAPTPTPAVARPAPAPAPPPVIKIKATPKARPSAAQANTRSKPSLAKRAAKRKDREMAMKWVGVIMTVVLLSLAGIFLVKILGMSSGEAKPTPEEAQAAKAEEEKKKRRSREIKTLTLPGEKESSD